MFGSLKRLQGEVCMGHVQSIDNEGIPVNVY